MLGCGNLNILLRFVKKIYSLPVVYSLKKKENNWKNDVSFYKKKNIFVVFYTTEVYTDLGKHFKKHYIFLKNNDFIKHTPCL